MADKVDKPKKKAKSKKDEKGVLAALPSTRPERIGGRRRRGARRRRRPPTATAASKAAAKPSPDEAAPRRRREAGRDDRTEDRRGRRRPARDRGAGARPPRPRTFEPTAGRRGGRRRRRRARRRRDPAVRDPARAAEERTYPRPRPVSEGAPGIGTAGYRDQPSPESGRPSGVELAATAVKAAGEVAQLGLTIGGQVLKRVADRLPKP